MTRSAFGYIRRDDANDEEINRVHDVLTGHARREGLALVEVYVDRNTPSDQLVRAGFSVLLEELRRYDAAIVLVAGAEHLSTSPPMRRALEGEIVDCGGAVQIAALPPSLTRPPFAAPRVFQFPATATSAREARARGRHVLRAWHLDEETTSTTVLLISELVANAITASTSPYEEPEETGRNQTDRGFVSLRLSLSGPRLLLEVWDRADTPPHQQDQDLTAESGRGLVLVSALSARWSFYPTRGGGKVVWCEITLPRPQNDGRGARSGQVLPRRTPPAGPPGPGNGEQDPDLLRRVVLGLRRLDDWSHKEE
ncbi:putative Histidine kinase-like ATPase domain-containing protein [Frankia canadensis]|uniref:Putative Histidine kinase-like ATPase domain-containing protein n=1 Tax=Frankia canadensis TaxID=1836972 RepID=A0A2I2KLR8_9ACTN|nr:ATP-binding protein [Frankia canadensis]SNQ46599.1 putative Histidine kinase-like ATPase domain-containing protein [Frankia canadensis]SOU53889.1 putative Histidine kinase-like ATPase domain-containing protein [Frankia canadensis]